ncbi:hypothetical protein CCHOA_04175 [Corynebacterium choanae]|uniref:Uncharacterized protein n=1 Tax=Corynebacterium choanae TaxID=1862358 RepID=A0A3G6JB41_9CORY|nr:hypothetical protein CCHOA_04175 [Corynebacterium choanae]
MTCSIPIGVADLFETQVHHVVGMLFRSVELEVLVVRAGEMGDHTVIFVAVTTLKPACPECCERGRLRDHMTRGLN